MRDIYLKILKSFKQNRVSVLVTLIGHTGSVPRGSGTKLLIMEDGSSVGTIGGGLLEKSAIEKSKEVFASLSPIRYNHVLKGSSVTDTDMLCGGDVELFLEPISPENQDRIHVFEMIMDMMRKGGSGVLGTILDIERRQHPGTARKIFINSNGEKAGSFSGIRRVGEDISKRMDQLLADKQPQILFFRDDEGKEISLFVEPMISYPMLYLFGGGHVSSQVAPLANRVGFRVVVIDDRPEFADPARFPEAEEVYNYSYEGVIERLPINESSYLVIVTHGHVHDKTVLTQSLRTQAGYIGMIGSKRKVRIIYEKLMKEGFTQEQLDRVHSPIGIEIGAESPEEIAVSIVAELIKVRAGA